MALYAVVAIIFFVITFLSTHERIQPITKERTSVKNDLKDITKNLPWVVLFAVTILFILFVCIRLSITVHYFKYHIGTQQITLFGTTHSFDFEWPASAFNVVGQGASLPGVVLVPWFSRKLGRKNAAIALFAAAILFTALFILLRPGDLVWIFLLQLLSSVSAGPVSPLLWAMYADTADHSEWKTGRRATGLVYSASIMSNKLGWAVGAMCAGWILALTGFQANVAQNLDVLTGLTSMMSVIPAVPGVIALILLIFFYKLDEPTMNKIKEVVGAQREAAGIPEAS